MRLYEKILVILLLLTPAMPKLYFGENITIYALEIWLLLGIVFLYSYFTRTKIQKSLFYFWLITFFSTIISQLYFENISGLMKCIKGMVYVPVVYFVYKNKTIKYKYMAYAFIVATLIYTYYMVSIGWNPATIEIWGNKEFLFSGFSGRAYSFSSGSFSISEGGTHGIWGNYSILAFGAAYLSFKKKEINLLILTISFILCAFNITMSVSREAMVTAIFLFFGIFLSMNIKGGKIRMSFSAHIVLAILIIVGVYIISKYGNSMALVQKVLYTQDSIQSSGEEHNLSSRIGGWYIFFKTLSINPIQAIGGFGYNFPAYAVFAAPVANEYYGDYVLLPESFILESLMIGGVFGFYFAMAFLVSIYKKIKHLYVREYRLVVYGLFFGLLFVNVFSGASILADLLYGQFLMFIGILLRDVIKVSK